MPKELKEDFNWKTAVALYKEKIGKEPFQPLSSLLDKLKNLWTLNSTISSTQEV